MREDLFRAPRRGVRYWVALFGGCLEIFFTFLLPIGNWVTRLVFVCVGAMLIFLGVAEVLPRNQTTLAGLLRIAYYLALLLMILAAIAARLSYTGV